MSQKTALITGGTNGIGKATALTLLNQGYQVAVTGQSPESVAAAQQELGHSALALHADLRSTIDIERAVDAVGERFGQLGFVFLNAGILTTAPLGDVDLTTLDESLEVNFKGQFATLQRSLPLLSNGASIVATVGVAVGQGMPGGSVVAATRAALLGLVPSLALELAPRGIRVNAVSPGAIYTRLWDGVPSEARDSIAAKIPLGRLGTPTDVADLVAFLASDASSYITGQHISVAGGSDLGF